MKNEKKMIPRILNPELPQKKWDFWIAPPLYRPRRHMFSSSLLILPPHPPFSSSSSPPHHLLLIFLPFNLLRSPLLFFFVILTLFPTLSTHPSPRLWDLRSGRCVRLFTGSPSPLSCVAISASSPTIGSARSVTAMEIIIMLIYPVNPLIYPDASL